MAESGISSKREEKEGKGGKKGRKNNLTVVTGFFDIGRDTWGTKHSRTNETYFKYIRNMMGLDVRMVIFSEPKNVNKFIEYRKGKEAKTVFILKGFDNLRMYPFKDLMRQCQNDPKIMNGHPDGTCPEVLLPEYNILVNSKFALLREAVEKNPFNTEYFCWIDAGYTHSTIDLMNREYNPTQLYNYKNRITFSQLLPTRFMVKGNHPFFLQHIDVVSAGFIFGYGKALIRFEKIYYDFFTKILTEDSISDDEQYYMALLLRERPELFNPIFMDWFGSLKLI